MKMKTYQLTITMDAYDVDDFISAVLELNERELREHVKEANEEEGEE